jgi:hypothetical protein
VSELQRSPRGIYVERLIRGPVDEVWRLSQTPALHQRWDLRFTTIQYLPRASESDPQQFLYETRIGFGIAVAGTGESVGERKRDDGSATSALKFASDDWKSLIESGSGYWRYLPVEGRVRFLTWYDYKVRFGAIGRLVDRAIFRPLMGWATAWSFDRLRLWVEEGQTPETSMMMAQIHAVARVTIAFIWAWHGVVPKLIFHDADERTMLLQAGLSARLLPWFGSAELLFALAMLLGWRWRWMFLLNAGIMAAALAGVAVNSPHYLSTAFNPVTLNVAMIALSAIGFLTAGRMPSAARCLRVMPKTTEVTL